MFLSRRVLRYLLVGGINTAVTYVVYLILLGSLGYAAAYSIAYVLGIVLSYWLNATLVFQARKSWRSFALFPSVYVVQYIVGLGVVYVFVSVLHLPQEAAPLVAIAATLPVGYLLSRRILAPQEQGQSKE